jgi:hypothetical protein
MSELPEEFTIRHGLMYGPKGNRIYEEDEDIIVVFDLEKALNAGGEDDILSPALRELLNSPGVADPHLIETFGALPSLPPSRRNLNHMPETTWLNRWREADGIPPHE